jgi:hypothetical protein
VFLFFVIGNDIFGVRLVSGLQTSHSGVVVDKRWDGAVFSIKLLATPLLHDFMSAWCNCVTVYILFNYCVVDLGQGGLYININIYGINHVKQLYR